MLNIIILLNIYIKLDNYLLGIPLQKFHMNMFQNHMSSHPITHVITRVRMSSHVILEHVHVEFL